MAAMRQAHRLPRPTSRLLWTQHTGRTRTGRRSFAGASVRAQAEGAAGPNPEEGQGQQSGRGKRAGKAEEENQGAPVGTTPWARFVEVLKQEYQKSREFQENVRELSGKAEGIGDSAAAQRMKQAYTAMRLQNIIRENPRLSQMASSISATGRSVSDVVNRTAKEIEDSALVQAARKAAERVDKAIDPIRQTDAYKAVEDTVDFSQGALRYGGYIEKSERHRRRKKRLERLGKADRGMGVLGGPGSRAHAAMMDQQAGAPPSGSSAEPELDTAAGPYGGVQANPEAAPALVLHASANASSASEGRSRLSSITPEPLRRAWASFSEAYAESENPLVAGMRSVTGVIGRFFDETETAKVVRWIKEMDPDFEMDGLLRDLREYVVPEIVDAYVGADLATLKKWTSEGAYNVITAPTQMYIQRGLKPESQVVDLRGIDIMSAKILEERDLPVIVVAFRTHEITAFVNRQTGVVEAGNADQIDQVQYVMVMTREQETCGDEETGGWRVIDMARRGSAAFL